MDKEYIPKWSEEIFAVIKIKNTVPWTYTINDLDGEEVVGKFYEKELQKTNHKEFRIKKVIKERELSYMSNEKVMIVYLIVGLIKKTF